MPAARTDEFLLIGNEWQQSKYLSMFPIELLGVKTNPANSARNRGVIFDERFTFRSHISAVISSCVYHMWDLRHIRRHLDLDSAKLLATALVSTRLDYCNSLLYGIADIDLTRLQHVQNQLARLVTKSPPFPRSLPLLCSLHWLPVRLRILFKINLLTYKTLHEKQPVYIHSMLAASLPSCSPRSNKGITLWSLESRPILVLELFTLAPCLFGTSSHCLFISVATFRKHLETFFFNFALLPQTSAHPMSSCCASLILQVDCRTTGPIGAIEIWLIDWWCTWLYVSWFYLL